MTDPAPESDAVQRARAFNTMHAELQELADEHAAAQERIARGTTSAMIYQWIIRWVEEQETLTPSDVRALWHMDQALCAARQTTAKAIDRAAFLERSLWERTNR